MRQDMVQMPDPEQGKEDEEEKTGIEVSASKVKIEVGEEDEIEIKNYEDLKKLDFEVEDEDIATVEEDDDGVYIVTGVSEGKTSVTFTAKDCEDVTVKIMVEGGMEPQPTVETVFDLSAYDVTVDYDDYESYIYIYNWDEIREIAESTITVESSDESVMNATFNPDDGSIYLCAWDEGYATVSVAADGFETAYCSVECTYNSSGSTGGNSGNMPDYDELDVNYDGSVNLWSYNMGRIVATMYAPAGYTLDEFNGGFYSEDNIYYVYFDSMDSEDQWITVVSEMPYDEWDYIVNGNEPSDFRMSNMRSIGEYNGAKVCAVDEDFDGYEYIIIYYDYYNSSNDNTDYVGIVIPSVLAEGWDDNDLWDLFCEMLDY